MTKRPEHTKFTTLGDCIQSARRGHGLSQRQLAQRIDCSVNTIFRIEHNSNAPSAVILACIGNALGVDLWCSQGLWAWRPTMAGTWLSMAALRMPWHTLMRRVGAGEMESMKQGTRRLFRWVTDEQEAAA